MNGLISTIQVKNKGPINASVLIIGEAPGKDEEEQKEPFVGKSGELLEQVLNTLLIDKKDVRLANLCQYRPRDNRFEHIEDSDELKRGIQELKSYIQEQRSTLRVIILLGERPLNYIGKQYGISKWRGSVIDVDGINCIATYHPAYVLRDRKVYPIFTFDLGKAFEVSRNGYTPTENRFTINPKGLDQEECILNLLSKKVLSADIESKKGTTYIRCCGFAWSNSDAVVFKNTDYRGMDYTLFNTLKRIFESEEIEFVFHNGIFDVIMLAENGIYVKNWKHDTMIAQHVLQPEFKKSLAFLMTIYTNRPYHKGMTATDDEDTKGWNDKVPDDVLLEYNCIDCVATYEVYTKIIEELKEEKLYEFYEYEMEMQQVALHFSKSGMLRDNDQVEIITKILHDRIHSDQELLNNIVGTEVNVRSGPIMKKVLYEQYKLPVRKTYDGTITTDEDAIVSLIAYVKDYISSIRTEDKKFEWQKKLAVLKLVLRIREYRQLVSNYIHASFSVDCRIRSTYKVAGTETGRFATSKYVDGTGINAATMPRAILEIDDATELRLFPKLILEEVNNG